MAEETTAFSFLNLEGTLPDVIPRKKIANYFGGLLDPRSMANMDCRGVGPSGRVIVGRDVVYPKIELLIWLQNRTKLPVKKSAPQPVQNSTE